MSQPQVQSLSAQSQPQQPYSNSYFGGYGSYYPGYSRDEADLLKIEMIKDFNVDFDLLKSIMLHQSPTRNVSLNNIKADFLLKTIKDLTGVEGVKLKDNLYFTKGESDFYPTIVAHYDTAQDYHEGFTVNVGKNWIYGFDEARAKQCGIGADDSVGIYFAIEMLKRLKHCKVVLFHSEESGCIGSHDCDMKFFDNSIIVTQLDRRSYTTDFIKYTNGVQTFSEAHYDLVKPLMEKYGYTFNNGSCTDIGALRQEGLAVSSHNLSCGYLNEHTDEEVIHIPSMQNAFCFAQEMLEMLLERNEPLTFPTPVKTLKSSLDTDEWNIWNNIPKKQAATFSEEETERVLENLYATFYSFYDLDTDCLCRGEAYYGSPSDYQIDLEQGELSPELFVALTGKGYDLFSGEILTEIPTRDDIVSALQSGICPITKEVIDEFDIEYLLEYHVLYLRTAKVYLPFQYEPDDVINLPDDVYDTMKTLYTEHIY